MLFKNIIFHEKTPRKNEREKMQCESMKQIYKHFKNIFTREHRIWPLLKLFVQFPVPRWGYCEEESRCHADAPRPRWYCIYSCSKNCQI